MMKVSDIIQLGILIILFLTFLVGMGFSLVNEEVNGYVIVLYVIVSIQLALILVLFAKVFGRKGTDKNSKINKGGSLSFIL